MTEYLEKAQRKALLHRATAEPVQLSGNDVFRFRFGVECKAKGGLGPTRQRIHQKTELGNQICRCSCYKSQRLHRPCTHVIAACYEIRDFNHNRYVPEYYEKETVLSTWNQTIEGYLVRGSFTQDPKENAVYIPDPDLDMCQGVGRRKKKRIRNNMDESEASPAVIICSKCNNSGHTYKRCTAVYYGCNAPSSSSVGAAAPSGTSRTSTGRSNNRRGRGRA